MRDSIHELSCGESQFKYGTVSGLALRRHLSPMIFHDAVDNG